MKLGRKIVDIYQKLFVKLFKIGCPNYYKGFKINYCFKSYQAEIEIKNTEEKILKMWELL